jgi:hypothetical protein
MTQTVVCRCQTQRLNICSTSVSIIQTGLLVTKKSKENVGNTNISDGLWFILGGVCLAKRIHSCFDRSNHFLECLGSRSRLSEPRTLP